MDFSALEIAGIRAIELLELKRDSYASGGEYPFLIGDANDLARLNAIARFECRSPCEIVRRSQAVDLTSWMIRRQEEMELCEFDAQEMIGCWPEHAPEPRYLSVHRDVATKEVKPRVRMGLARISEPWHLPAVLRFGNWNDCPDAVVHCAFFHHWQERFGAEIATASGNTIECIVRRPPEDRDTAMELAWEQFWYCEQTVYQSRQSVSNLAASLIDLNYWCFWWD